MIIISLTNLFPTDDIYSTTEIHLNYNTIIQFSKFVICIHFYVKLFDSQIYI